MMYLFLILLLVTCMLLYFRLADHFNIIDRPNHRSSHTQITIRGGGIIFPLAVIVCGIFYGFTYPYFVIGLILIAAISFLDDVVTLQNAPRLIIHLISVMLLFYGTGIFDYEWYWWLIAFVLTIGWINAFNFMDGINGITALYALINLISFIFVNIRYPFISVDLLYLLTVATLIFTYFNARKQARTFAGDVGSISMAFILGFLMIRLILTSGHWEYILFFSVYGIDAVLTIFHRLLKRENILQAHRSHLYQYLANEQKLAHLTVSSCYALIQLIINVIISFCIVNSQGNSSLWAIIILLLLFISYIVFKAFVLSRIKNSVA